MPSTCRREEKKQRALVHLAQSRSEGKKRGREGREEKNLSCITHSSASILFAHVRGKNERPIRKKKERNLISSTFSSVGKRRDPFSHRHERQKKKKRGGLDEFSPSVIPVGERQPELSLTKRGKEGKEESTALISEEISQRTRGGGETFPY